MNPLRTTFRVYSPCRVFALAAVILLAACSDDDEQVIPEIEAAEVILTAVTPRSGGVVEQVRSSAFIANELSPFCSFSVDTTFIRQRFNANFVHEYEVQLTALPICISGNSADTVVVNFISEGYTENRKLRSVDVSDGDLHVTQFDQALPFFLVNGTIIRPGSQQMKVRRSNAFTSTITFTLRDVFINKSDFEVAGGRIDVRLTGAKGSEGNFSYSGILTFGASKNATLVLDSGQHYPLTW